MKSLLVLGLVALLGGACADPFESFNEVTQLRVLGVKAEPPAIFSGERAVMEALVAPGKDGEVAYHWSWCPLTAGSATGYECLVTQADLDLALLGLGGGGTSGLPPMDLGQKETAVFDFQLDPALLTGLCKVAVGGTVPAFVPVPTCDDSLTVTVKLTVRQGNQEVIAVKELPLLLKKDADRNANPDVGEISILDDGGAPLLGDTTLVPETDYDMVVDISEDAAQTFLKTDVDGTAPAPAKEVLFTTWFITGGALEFNRTGFIDGETDFEAIRQNRWTTPQVDEADGGETLWVVVQDERGGVNWTSLDVVVKEDAQ